MNFEPPLVFGTLLRRYKRFLADVELPEGADFITDGFTSGATAGTTLTVHCPNPGSMLGLIHPGARVGLRHSASPSRKHPYTWELVEIPVLHSLAGSPNHESTTNGNGSIWVGINTHNGNRLVREALDNNLLPELAGYRTLRSEVMYDHNSRCDFVLSEHEHLAPSQLCFLEVKTVHLSREPGCAEFPDAVTLRGTKHAEALLRQVEQGYRAVLLYVVQRADCTRLQLAADIDPRYAQAVQRARDGGVEVLAYACDVSPTQIAVAQRVLLAF
jgi:sugar fermentation stimulation protein A